MKFFESFISFNPTIDEWRRAFKLLVLGPLDNENEVVGVDGATKILGGNIVLSEWRRPGKWACTRSRFESGLEAADVREARRTTSSILIDVRLDSRRNDGGRWGYDPNEFILFNVVFDSRNDSVLTKKKKKNKRLENVMQIIYWQLTFQEFWLSSQLHYYFSLAPIYFVEF